ncbi:hypothetical protein K402DRAFT_351026 [Aulographum hederae CBS 113979]|uniref:Large ribosomal subunit protein eL14 domain-containing protein n=1 Tax=Aulographum hederae CBS 113979 TaxID=1176131 RepID=A0A6G1H7P5_9PEZI|nr:hypothetical protein K402DRAFT_351026 [Aulographum hederae CBS 113979]
MGDADIKTTQWRLVEVGRVVLFTDGPYIGRLAAIVEIVDHKRILVDGPSETKGKEVVRHCAPIKHVSLTPIVLPKLPRGIGNGALKKAWSKEGVDGKWANSAWAKSREQSKKRQTLNDFERFKVMKLRKQVRYEQRKALAKIKASA